MPDTKRPNYFTSQFLVEKDFNDEQAYHLNTRRRHARVLHTSGVADGLDVTRVSATQVQVGVGTAIDKDGREIMLNDPRTYTLVTAGNDLDVFLTIGYQELLDPADHDTQAGLDKFTRTTERPLLQDGTAAPPVDGSVVVLARIHLNSSGAIASNSSIDTTVRAVASAKIAPKSVNSAQLADGAVTLAKLATEAQPLTVQGANAVTVTTDNTLKRITVGENHSARVDNPHGTTAAQVDSQGGVNQLVTQINAGTGVIVRSRLESTVVSGVVTFQNLGVGIEMFSNDIDPGFGPGAVGVQLALDDAPAVNLTSGGDTNYFRVVQLRSEINRSTGRFRIFATRNIGSTVATATVRWYAFRPQPGADTSVAVGVVVSPNTANLVNNNTQGFTAAVSNTSNTGVTWSVTEANGGTLTSTTPTSTMYVPPGISGTYHVVATSVADPNRKGAATVVVNADITVNMSRLSATVFRGDSLVLNATVVNTSIPGVSWSILQGGGGSLSSTTATSATYTAPLAPGTYTVIATSNADGNKKGTCTITVPPVTIVITPDNDTVTAGSSTVIRATITGTSDNRANWSSPSPVPSISPAVGPATTWFAPGVGGFFGVNATAVADTSKSSSTNITVPNVGGGGGGGGGGKFSLIPIVENIALSSNPSPSEAPVSADEASQTGDEPRSFVRPKKRPNTKLPPEPSDG